MFHVFLGFGLCCPRIVEITIMYECGLTARKCKVPIVYGYGYNNVVAWSTAPSTGLLLRLPAPPKERSLVEGFWSMSHECAATLLHTVGERETETWGQQLLDVWTADILALRDLNNPEDLKTSTHRQSAFSHRDRAVERTWIERKRARCLAAMSW